MVYNILSIFRSCMIVYLSKKKLLPSPFTPYLSPLFWFFLIEVQQSNLFVLTQVDPVYNLKKHTLSALFSNFLFIRRTWSCGARIVLWWWCWRSWAARCRWRPYAAAVPVAPNWRRMIAIKRGAGPAPSAARAPAFKRVSVIRPAVQGTVTKKAQPIPPVRMYILPMVVLLRRIYNIVVFWDPPIRLYCSNTYYYCPCTVGSEQQATLGAAAGTARPRVEVVAREEAAMKMRPPVRRPFGIVPF